MFVGAAYNRPAVVMTEDARAQQAREHHKAAARAERTAGHHRLQRDRLVRQLRAADPGVWTVGRLARVVQCSEGLIRVILGRAERTPQ